MRTKQPQLEDGRRPLCAYHLGVLYCPLPGTFCPTALGDGTWYCWLHFESRPQGAGADDDLRRIIATQGELRREHYHMGNRGALWDPVIQSYTYNLETAGPRVDHIEERMQANIAAHPEWRRQSAESKKDYGSRMIASMRGEIGNVLKSLPYDPSARLAEQEAAEEREAIRAEGG